MQFNNVLLKFITILFEHQPLPETTPTSVPMETFQTVWPSTEFLSNLAGAWAKMFTIENNFYRFHKFKHGPSEEKVNS